MDNPLENLEKSEVRTNDPSIGSLVHWKQKKEKEYQSICMPTYEWFLRFTSAIPLMFMCVHPYRADQRQTLNNLIEFVHSVLEMAKAIRLAIAFCDCHPV